MKIEWSDKYITGKHQIDVGQKLLFTLFNDIVDKLEKNYQSEEVEAYVRLLEEHATIHFRQEKRLLKKLPENIYQEHLNEHKEFKKVIKTLSRKIYKDKEVSSIYELVLFIGEWILNHVQYTDKYHIKNTT